MSLFENTGISLLWRIIGSYLAGIYNAHLGGTFADDYEDYCLSERGCVYAFRTAKVFKCFFIANFSKSWGFFEIEIPVNFRTQLIQVEVDSTSSIIITTAQRSYQSLQGLHAYLASL